MKTSLLFFLSMMLAIPSFSQFKTSSSVENSGKITVIKSYDSLLVAGTDSGRVFTRGIHQDKWKLASDGLVAKGAITDIVVTEGDIFLSVTTFLNETVYRSTDGAATWKPFGLFGFTFTLAATADQLVAGTWYGVSFSSKSTPSWASSTDGLPSNAGVEALSFTANDIFCGVTSSSVGEIGVYKSTDNGKKWTVFNTGIGDKTVSRLVAIDDMLFAGTKGGLYMSPANIANWKKSNNGLTGNSIKTIQPYGNLLFVSTDNGLFMSQDKGSSWKKIGDGLPSTHPVSSIVVADEKIMVSANNQVWSRPMSELGITIGINEAVQNEGISTSIYPNPWNEQAKLVFSETIEEAVCLIYNSVGELVDLVNIRHQTEMLLNRHEFNAGLYIYSIQKQGVVISSGKFSIIE